MNSGYNHKVVEAQRARMIDIEVWDNGIIFFKLDQNSEVTLSDCEFNLNFVKSKFDGTNKHLILAEVGDFATMSMEAREFVILPENNLYTKACAVVANSIADRILLNFMILFIKKQGINMKSFHNNEKAIEWLLSFKG